MPLLVVGAYRSDGLPRVHGVRRLRNDLRRGGRLEEIALSPLSSEETGRLLGAALGDAPAPALVRAIQDRTEGIPFFVEELASALRVSGALRAGPQGVGLATEGAVPIPDTVRDAVLIGFAELDEECRRAAEVAAVAGESFDLGVVAGLAGDAGLTALLESGLVREEAGRRRVPARARARGDLRRPALDGPPRAAPRAGRGARGSAAPPAATWPRTGSRRTTTSAPARRCCSPRRSPRPCTPTATPPTPAAARWSSGPTARAPERAEALERYARCSQLAGELGEAVWAWRELLAIAEDDARVGRAQRSLAAVQELRGDREAAVAARLAAAAAFGAIGAHAEAAVERIAIANQRRLGAATARRSSWPRSRRRGRRPRGPDRPPRAGDGRRGHGAREARRLRRGAGDVRAGLAQALEHDLTAVAAELYQRLSVTLYESADYRRAEEALDTALELCRMSGDAPRWAPASPASPTCCASAASGRARRRSAAR